MKKLIVAILSLVYLTASVGITLQRHFCMNRFVGWSLSDTGKELCTRCGMDKSEKKNGCCKDETLKLKIGDDQQPSFIDITFHQPDLPVTHGSFLTIGLVILPAANEYAVDHGPPAAGTIPVFLLHRVFRI